jgi:hypothetical protein
MVWSTVGAKPAVATWHCLRMMTEVGLAVGWRTLRADLDRFTFLLGGNDGEFLLGQDPP